MLNFIDSILNRVTMYKLVLYYLLVILFGAFVLSLFGVLSYSPLALIFSVSFITLVCVVTNIIFAWAFKSPENVESSYITALILSLIITPLSNPKDFGFFAVAFWASVLAIASKYILAIKHKHIFNPAAIAVVITSLTLGLSASWWVGTTVLAPFVIIGGLLLTRKIIRTDLVLSFVVVALILSTYGFIQNGVDFWNGLWTAITGSAILFFAFVMFTEPLTTPPTRELRILYGIFTGLMFWPNLHFGALTMTPALALVIGNIFSYAVSPKQKLFLTLKDRIEYVEDTFHFIFSSDQKLKFLAGQYLEWTIGGKRFDSRGNRRYFTIASAPTEKEIGLGVKFFPNSSDFKIELINLRPNEKIIASQLAGDFTLTEQKEKKIVFLAGGIGITPFRSMIKELIDKNEKRDIVQIYSNKTSGNVAYKEIFNDAERKLGIKTIYLATDENDPRYTGRLSAEIIKNNIPDLAERLFYISGPHGFVVAAESILKSLGVKNSQIKKDYFPGFA